MPAPPTNRSRLILLLGVTASGKSSVALELAGELDAEIVSVDSMQVYRRMDIGTAKPTESERHRVPHHLMDVAEPSESFSVARFVEMADAAIAEIAAYRSETGATTRRPAATKLWHGRPACGSTGETPMPQGTSRGAKNLNVSSTGGDIGSAGHEARARRGRLPLVLAGTPLYLMGLMYGMFDGPSADEAIRAELRRRADDEGLASLHAELVRVDPAAARRIHVNDYKRIERALEVYRLTGKPLSEQQAQWSAEQMRYPATVVGIRREKEDASRRINARVKAMIQAGLVEEVRSLLAETPGPSEQARQALGYAQIIDHLEGRMSLADAVEQIKIQTRRLAKHQRTWFRKFQTTRWLDVGSDESESSICRRLVQLIAL